MLFNFPSVQILDPKLGLKFLKTNSALPFFASLTVVPVESELSNDKCIDYECQLLFYLPYIVNSGDAEYLCLNKVAGRAGLLFPGICFISLSLFKKIFSGVGKLHY